MLHKRMPPAACEEPSNRPGHSELGTGNEVRSQADPWEADPNESGAAAITGVTNAGKCHFYEAFERWIDPKKLSAACFFPPD